MGETYKLCYHHTAFLRVRSKDPYFILQHLIIASYPLHLFNLLKTTIAGVRDQPYGDVETRQGAINRAKAAYDAACSNTKSSIEYPDFAVGLEGGLEKLSHPKMDSQNTTDDQADELLCMAWMAILGSNSKTCIAAKAEGDNFSSDDKTNPMTWGYAKTGSFLLPPAICELVINENMELGHADDKVFKRVNSKHGSGTVGVLTDGEIDRADYYVHALKLALVPWVRPELYLDKYLA